MMASCRSREGGQQGGGVWAWTSVQRRFGGSGSWGQLPLAVWRGRRFGPRDWRNLGCRSWSFLIFRFDVTQDVFFEEPPAGAGGFDLFAEILCSSSARWAAGMMRFSEGLGSVAGRGVHPNRSQRERRYLRVFSREILWSFGLAVFFEIGNDFADFGDFAILFQNLCDGSGFGRGQLDGCFFAFQGHDRSSFCTTSPCFFSQPPISTSVIDSPTVGTFSSRAMRVMRVACCVKSQVLHFEALLDQFLLFEFMLAVGAGGW